MRSLRRIFIVGAATIVAIASLGAVAFANHVWGNYHWARTANPFTLKLGDNVSTAWDSYLGTTSADWSLSDVLDTTIVAGQGRKNCRATAGRVEVCNGSYGKNGWLGIASIWASGDHITQGTVKLNDTYFKTTTYNTPAWKNLVMCQEVGHTFGLNHQDEDFANANLGTCMDYTSNPADNQHPNVHDYEELALIYSHVDTVTTVGQTVQTQGNKKNAGNLDDESEWGRETHRSKDGRTSKFERNLGNDEKVFTFVTWAEPRGARK